MTPRAAILGLALTSTLACRPDGDPATTDGATGTASNSGDLPIEVPPGSLLDDPLQPLPPLLSEVGLYVQLPDRQIVPDVAVLYEPIWPLWSNGSDKQRFLILPAGQTIDNSTTPWTFPVGTLLFKTFTYGDEPIETRLLRLTAAGEWDYAVYRWNDDASDAELLDTLLPTPVEAPIGTHTIPATLDCRSCHESTDSEVIGLDEIQLGPSLPMLAERGLFAVPPPEVPETIEHPDETTRQVLGWLHGDCVHCHNGSDGPSSSFDLRAAVALDNLIGVESESSGSAGGIRVAPGDPGASLMFLAVSGESDDPEIKLMPPVGVDVPDAASVELVRGWIEGLE